MIEKGTEEKQNKKSHKHNFGRVLVFSHKVMMDGLVQSFIFQPNYLLSY